MIGLALAALLALPTQDPATDPPAANPPAVEPPAPTPAPPPVPGHTTAQGLAREEMWRPPTEAEWAQPTRIQWQRTWDDALAVSRETGRPILVAINMDGEIASEHYAGVRYRQPEVAALFEPYVCVIASVYRHTPRDHDELGRRIVCPRFGTVTCGEHVSIEPNLFEQFMKGERVSPRHVMVELDGSETYDVYYAFDTASVFETVRDGILERELEPYPDDRGDRTLVERVESADSADREAVESAYAEGDAETKRALVRAAVEQGAGAPADLLRLAIFDLDSELARLAREGLAASEDPAAVDLILEALRAPLPEAERDALVAALERHGAEDPRAATLAATHRGLATRSGAVDAEGWARALAEADRAAPDQAWTAVEYRLASSVRARRASADEAGPRLDFAEASIRYAVDPNTRAVLPDGRRTREAYRELMLEDARRAALEAGELGGDARRVAAAVALADYYLGRKQRAYEQAPAAVEGLEPGDPSWEALAALALFAEARREAVLAAVRARADWSREWLSDVHQAYTAIGAHPLAQAGHTVAHYDFLLRMGAVGQAAAALQLGLDRFPESPDLHARYRTRVLYDRGVAGLLAAYDARLEAPDHSPALPWFAGYAALVAAEFHRRASEVEAAEAAYEVAIARFEQSIAENPESRPSSDHYVAIAIAGRARVALDQGELEVALGHLLAAIERAPRAAASLDGLNASAVTTGQLLRARLAQAGLEERAAEIDAAFGRLRALDPDLLLPPGYDRVGPVTRTPDGRRPLRRDERPGDAGGGGR